MCLRRDKNLCPGEQMPRESEARKKSVLGGTGVQGKQAFGGNREEENI